jgi:DNA-binding NtrC family response regulator
VPLARAFLAARASACGETPKRLTAEAERALLSHDWPGNVRELQNEVIRALVRARGAASIGIEHLTVAETATLSLRLRSVSREFEKGVVADALARSNGNRTHAARALGISRQGLYRKLKRYGMTRGKDGAVRTAFPNT